MLVTYFVNFRQLNDHLFGKELFIRFAASAFRKLPSVYVFSYFPFGFEGRMWGLIVSVPDHCLFFTLHQGLSEPELYGDLVYKLKKIEGRADCSDQFRKIIVLYKRIGYNINIMRQFACLVFNPITVNNFASLFNCMPVGRASDSMMAPTS